MSCWTERGEHVDGTQDRTKGCSVRYLSSMSLVHQSDQNEEGKIMATFELSRNHSFPALYIVLHHPQPLAISTLFSYFNPPL